MFGPERSRYSAVRSLGSAVFLLFAGRGSSSLLEGGEGISSGAGEVLADERREEDGDMYARRWAKDRFSSGGGVGERERIETSESEMSEPGASLNGELGALFSAVQAMVKRKAAWILWGVQQ
jgi:hypothetical protein